MYTQIDNWLEEDMVKYLDDKFTYDYPHYFGQRSVKGAKEFYISEMNPHEPLNDFLFTKLKTTLNKDLNLIRMYINIQHEGMESDFHSDDGDLTCLYMASETLPDSGAFEIYEEQTVPFVQNTLVCFDAMKLHKGHAPLNTNKPRITLAFKTSYEENR
jgi:hypothetical protein|tara:strand:+ start:6773 stop:7246 length:474 start_codon:yes stop_codon:yes gene_type:complete